MANTFYWDFGFDFNAVQNPRTQTDFLAIGFVLAQPSNANVPATPVGLSIGDTISFFAYEITSNPAGRSSITGGTINFTNAVAQFDSNKNMITSPFNDGNGNYLTTIPISAVYNGYGMSTIFSGIQAPQAALQNVNVAKFPSFSCGSQTVANLGRFLFTVTLNITGPDGTNKTFYVDPEMIVGGTN